MKKISCLLVSLISMSTAMASDHLPVIKERIAFTSLTQCDAPPMLAVDMTHRPGTTTRDFAFPKDSPYAQLTNFSRWPSEKADEMGYFTDQAVNKAKDYIVTLSGRVSSYTEEGQTKYRKSGTWMDSKGCFGTWVDLEQQEHALTPLAACHTPAE